MLRSSLPLTLIIICGVGVATGSDRQASVAGLLKNQEILDPGN